MLFKFATFIRRYIWLIIWSFTDMGWGIFAMIYHGLFVVEDHGKILYNGAI